LFIFRVFAEVWLGGLLISENELLWIWAKERHDRRLWGKGEDDGGGGVCGLSEAKEIGTFKSSS
jgi:hypothetical protein